MSHFTVGVFIKEGGPRLEELLAPYQENAGDGCPQEYLEFEDVTDEYLKSYEEDTRSMVKAPDGKLLETSDERFRIPGTIGMGGSTHRVPEDRGYEEIEVPFKELYPDFDTFMTKYAGCEKNEKTGRYGFWQNPNAQWDWYQIGGRWSGLLLTTYGKRVDGAKLKDIDWEGMAKMARQRAEIAWEDANSDFTRSRAFKCYGYGIREGDTKESYVNRRSEFSTYSVITPDGEWHSADKMGWWGASSESAEEADQRSSGFYDRFIKNADPELMLVIIDCHI